LVRIHTDQGVSGIGDASHGRDERVIALVREFFQPMKGRSFSDIEHLRRLADPLASKERHSPACALGAIEQAMWDIAGRIFGVPVYSLFGGKLRDRVRNYANINRATFDRSPSGFAKLAERALQAGFDAVKLAPFDGWPTEASAVESHVRTGVECAQAVRKAIGPRADLLIDGHSHFTLERGLELAREFEPLNLFWLEEVCPGIENLAAINRAARMPTAGGESIFGVKGFYPYITGKAVDILMPDIKYCGGLLEMKKIAAMGDGAGLLVSPHGPASPVGNAAAAQVCVTLPNFQILEFAFGETEGRAELIEPAERIEKGALAVSDKPGFGITLNRSAGLRLV
ncbi:MAG: mandelate racemase/muconate lactonizing enzyme family protein, partial [Acidobacteria bacterium]|nr:mandelate racemase/muconate lactonizing enzyme family protein [Acidobacteriota bacterium]